ncbi:MAG TPA: YncE family protein [Nitrospira sp.]|nr:YncE family protein [Nitrospira sp.]
MTARTNLTALIFTGLGALSQGTAFGADTSPVLTALPAVQVSETPKRFDLLAMDQHNHRLLAAHAQAGALSVVDANSDKLRWDEPLGDHSSGVAVDSDTDRYYVSLDNGVAAVDSNTLHRTFYIDTPGPTDAIIYDPGTRKVYVGHDDGTELWVIDGKTEKLLGHINVPGVPELMDVDPASHHLYLNIKDKDEVAVIDTRTDTVVTTWSTPATHSPHGLVLDIHGGRVFVAGQSSKVSVFSLEGKPVGTIDIGPGRVDQIAFDPNNQRLYVPSSGRLVAVDVSGGAKVLGSVEIPDGTHSVAVDPDTHFVWIAYADKDHSYVQAYSPSSNNSH